MITHHLEYTASDGTHYGPNDVKWSDPHRHKYADAMSEFLDILGLDYADEDTGSTEWDIHAMRFGKRILVTDDRGFVECEKYDNEAECQEAFNRIDQAYAVWLDDEEGEGADDSDTVELCEVHDAPHKMGGFECEMVANEAWGGTE